MLQIMEGMARQRKAIIIGGGPAGLAAALYLHLRTNIVCSVYELRPEPTTLGGAVGILPNGVRLLHRLGLHDKIMARGSSHANLVVHSMQGSILGQHDLVQRARVETGFSYVRIKRTDLLEVLLEAVHDAKISIYYNLQLTSINEMQTGVKATFSDGTIEAADFLLGCDGIHSAVRRLCVDPYKTPEYTGIAGIGSIIPASLLPESAASQFRGLHATMTQEGMFMVMTCTASEEEVYWGFSREIPLPESGDTKDGWEVRRKDDVEGFKSKLRELLEGAGGEWGTMMRRIVDRTSVVKLYPIHKLPLGGPWSKGRCLLLGDAAHAMPPHAGQGVSMALEDASLLSRLLSDSTRPLAEVYKKFDELRRRRVDEIAIRAAQNGNLRKNTGPWGLWLKEVGVWMYMHGYWALGLDKWGSEHKDMVYDVDKVDL